MHLVRTTVRGVARDLAEPLREEPGPTFGNIPRHKPLDGADLYRVELVKQGDKWIQIVHGRFASPASGSYDFVVQDGRNWAVQSGTAYGHTEAANGGRVTFAGVITFEEPGVLKEWSNESGHHIPSATFAKNAGLDMNRFKAYDGPKRVPTAQLPVFQPNTKPRSTPPGKSSVDIPSAPALVVSGSIGPSSKVQAGVTTSVSKKEFAKALAEGLNIGTRSNRFMQRVNGYLSAWGALQSVLGTLAFIDTAGKMLAHGTAMRPEGKRIRPPPSWQSVGLQVRLKRVWNDSSITQFPFGRGRGGLVFKRPCTKSGF
jgi:hypothetical protein